MAKATTKPADTATTSVKEQKMTDTTNLLELGMNLEDFDDFEPLPVGTYEAEVRKAEKKVSDKGTEYYSVQFNIHPDDFPADYAVENAPEGLNLTYNRLMQPTPNDRRSITSIKRFYKALGLSLKTSTINCGDWEGKKAKIVVGRTEYNGELRNEIKSIEAQD